MLVELDKIINVAFNERVSDIHINKGEVWFRLNNKLVRREELDYIDSQTKSVVEELIGEELNNDIQLKDYNGSYFTGKSRFRVNIANTISGYNITMRLINENPPTPESIGLPDRLVTLSKERKKGLILITGPTGSGKSTSLAALIDRLNEVGNKNIITLEDPIEYVYKNKNSKIIQREIGRDTNSFEEGLSNILRQDPDVILVGEMRTPESFLAALRAAETGHLVLSTMHTRSAAETITRIADMFPDNTSMVLSMLSNSLICILSQMLLERDEEHRKEDEPGMVLAYEYLEVNNKVANNIKVTEKSGNIDINKIISHIKGNEDRSISYTKVVTDLMNEYLITEDLGRKLLEEFKEELK